MDNRCDWYIEQIKKIYPEELYLFKSCSIDWIVVLQKLDDTTTNQSRLSINDPNRPFAKYRANKLFVVKIINKFDPSKTINKISNSIHSDHTIEYIEEMSVEPDSFDDDLTKVCSNGIHFFESIDCAFYLELGDKEEYTGHLIQWREDGQKYSDGYYSNGKKNGLWIRWYRNGQISDKSNYLNGERNSHEIF